MQLARYRYALAVLLFLVSIAIPCVLYFREANYAALGLVGTFLGFFIFMIQDRVEHTAHLEQVAKFVEKHGPAVALAQAVVDGQASQTIRMDAADASDYVFQHIGEARRMYNTSFTNTETILSAPYKKWLSAIAAEVTERTVIFEEVMSSHDRLLFVQQHIGANPSGVYTPYFLDLHRGEHPYIEMCIFQYADGKMEVLFGWSSHTEDYKEDDVFLSRDKVLAKFFLSYFHRLTRLGKRSPSRPKGLATKPR